MKRLPKTREVIAEVMKLANAAMQSSEKTASAAPVYATGVAQEISKLAAALRRINPTAVTYADVSEFGQNLLRQR